MVDGDARPFCQSGVFPVLQIREDESSERPHEPLPKEWVQVHIRLFLDLLESIPKALWEHVVVRKLYSVLAELHPPGSVRLRSLPGTLVEDIVDCSLHNAKPCLVLKEGGRLHRVVFPLIKGLVEDLLRYSRCFRIERATSHFGGHYGTEVWILSINVVQGIETIHNRWLEEHTVGDSTGVVEEDPEPLRSGLPLCSQPGHEPTFEPIGESPNCHIPRIIPWPGRQLVEDLLGLGHVGDAYELNPEVGCDVADFLELFVRQRVLYDE